MKKAVKFFVVSVMVFAVTVTASAVYLFGGKESRRTVKVPDYVGMRVSDAASDADFEIKSEGVYSDLPKGWIISQSPYAGAERKLVAGERCKIKLTVSLGVENECVPDLSGYHYTEAANILRELGVKVRLVPLYESGSESGIVLRTSPTEGSIIEKGVQVTLFVSRAHVAESVTVGFYKGKQREAAVTEILSIGLYIGEIELEYSSQYKEGTVISQSIRHGSVVPYGSEISLTVSAGQRKEELHPFGRSADTGDVT